MAVEFLREPASSPPRRAEAERAPLPPREQAEPPREPPPPPRESGRGRSVDVEA